MCCNGRQSIARERMRGIEGAKITTRLERNPHATATRRVNGVPLRPMVISTRMQALSLSINQDYTATMAFATTKGLWRTGRLRRHNVRHFEVLQNSIGTTSKAVGRNSMKSVSAIATPPRNLFFIQYRQTMNGFDLVDVVRAENIV